MRQRLAKDRRRLKRVCGSSFRYSGTPEKTCSVTASRRNLRKSSNSQYFSLPFYKRTRRNGAKNAAEDLHTGLRSRPPPHEPSVLSKYYPPRRCEQIPQITKLYRPAAGCGIRGRQKRRTSRAAAPFWGQKARTSRAATRFFMISRAPPTLPRPLPGALPAATAASAFHVKRRCADDGNAI